MWEKAKILLLAASLGVSFAAQAAKPAKPEVEKPVTNPAVQAAEVLAALDAYRFNDALRLADRYAKVFNDAAADTLPSPEELRTRALMGTNMLERVQEVDVLERYIIDAQDVAAFLNQRLGYTLFLDEDAFGELQVPLAADSTYVQSAFLYPNGRTVLWSDDTADEAKLMVSRMLSDNTWDVPEEYITLKGLFPDEECGYTMTAPFVAQDGVTVYFGADGPQSLGGLDIFMTRCDPETGEFLRPLNMGMPFNSPANDFLLAIDERNGEGWWVTDRDMSQMPDSVMVYRYKLPGETRVNHPADAPDLVEFAKGVLGDDKTHIVELEDTEILLPEEEKTEPVPVALELADGTLITSVDMVDTTVGRAAVSRYLDALQAYKNTRRDVEELRARYAEDKSLKDTLLKAEQNLEAQRAALRKIQNAAIRALQ